MNIEGKEKENHMFIDQITEVTNDFCGPELPKI